jgi:hypothetical protein
MLLLATGLAAADPLPRGLAEARREIRGLRMHLCVPQSHYGPGDPVAVYVTLVNGGIRTLPVPADPRFVATWTVAGKEEVFPQDGPEQVSGPVPNARGRLQMAPGDRAVFRLTLRPPRRALIHGVYALRVTCDLTRSLGGTLASETSSVKIQYKVMVVF